MKVLLAVLAFASLAASADVMDVKSLNQVLQKNKAGWVAKSTPIGSLTKEQATRMMGLRRTSHPDVQFSNAKARVKSNLPMVLDWRNKDGINWVTPVLDQANCGSCVAFASIGTLETQYKIASGIASFNVKLSPQHLFSCGGGSCEMGWMPESAAMYLQKNGVPDEACLPYTSGATGQDVACSATCANASQRSIRIASYATPSRGLLDTEAVKQALQSGPLMTTLDVYADFMQYGSGVYKHVTGDVLGGHAISIIGYDDNQRAYIIRNSWGEGWGTNGFGYVSYDDVSGVGDETWGFSMGSMMGAVSVTSPIDYTYVAGSFSVGALSTYPNTDSMNIAFFDGAGKAVWNGTCGSKCDQAVDVSTLADGRYEVQAQALDKQGNKLGQSTRQFFYVANTQPTLGLTFTGVNGTDLSVPLKARIEVAVTSTSSSVPMSSVEFHYRGADGVDHMRAAFVVMNGLTMGWRTNLGPNGAYDIYLVGHVKTNAYDDIIESVHQTVQVQN
jgi:C1A family cysteine protease